MILSVSVFYAFVNCSFISDETLGSYLRMTSKASRKKKYSPWHSKRLQAQQRSI